MKKNLTAKIMESVAAVLPVTLIVIALSVTIAPISGEMMFTFAIGAVMLVLGIGLFTLGADTSMIIMGEKIGSGITRTKKIGLIAFSCFFIGVLITVAEPDLRVLADQAPIADNLTLILSVALGVGLFLLIAVFRIFLQIKLSRLLIIFYAAVFILALSPLVPGAFIPAAFDSGGVTTGPITVPFILALGVGLSAIRGDKTSQEDTFGLVALCSIGPVVTVLILGALSSNPTMSTVVEALPAYADTRETFGSFLGSLPEYMGDVAVAVAPIIGLCLLFQLVLVRMDWKSLKRVFVGFGFTYVGLVLFLTGANFGFMPVGRIMGESLANGGMSWLLVPVGALVGYFIVAAEPAVHVLKQQVEEVTEGRITGKSLGAALSVGVAVSVGLAMIRVLTGISIMWMLVPGYAFSLIMSFFVKPIFTAIAFDSGGVASGPMTATFLLPFAMGACAGIGGNVATDAFGVVAMVAMTPLIAIQMLGVFAHYKENKEKKLLTPQTIPDTDTEKSAVAASYAAESVPVIPDDVIADLEELDEIIDADED